MKRAIVLVLVAFGATRADFLPAVRVDRETRPTYACYHADIAIGPRGPSCQPIYVAFENDSVPFTIQRSDIAFQRSTDGGATWLEQDVLVRRGNRFACYPDLAVDDDGTIFMVYTDRLNGSVGHIHSVRSTDGGTTWSDPVQVDDNAARYPIGWPRLAIDTAGNLFTAWTDGRGDYLRVYSDVSTDRGETWGTDVRVDDDTVSFNCYPPDAYVQPGSNDYLVVADAPVRQEDRIVLHSHFYRSTDMGATFSPGFQLDTFPDVSRQPHVVADEDHVITDYTGDGWVNQCVTMARTWFEQGDSWGPQTMVAELDTIYSTFTNGSKLAIDPSGDVHIGLMFDSREVQVWGIWYAFSTDHGITWSEREEVSNLPTVAQWDPNIAVDDDGFAYLVWQDMRNPKAQIWFSTNSPTGISSKHGKPLASRSPLHPTIVRGWLRLGAGHDRNPSLDFGSCPKPALFDPSGRRVLELHLGENDLRALALGAYFLRTKDAAGRPATSRIVIVD